MLDFILFYPPVKKEYRNLISQITAPAITTELTISGVCSTRSGSLLWTRSTELSRIFEGGLQDRAVEMALGTGGDQKLQLCPSGAFPPTMKTNGSRWTMTAIPAVAHPAAARVARGARPAAVPRPTPPMVLYPPSVPPNPPSTSLSNGLSMPSVPKLTSNLAAPEPYVRRPRSACFRPSSGMRSMLYRLLSSGAPFGTRASRPAGFNCIRRFCGTYSRPCWTRSVARPSLPW